MLKILLAMGRVLLSRFYTKEDTQKVPSWEDGRKLRWRWLASGRSFSRLALFSQPQQDAQILDIFRPTSGLFHADQVVQAGKTGRCLADGILDTIAPNLLERYAGDEWMDIRFQDVLSYEQLFLEQVVHGDIRDVIAGIFERCERVA